jgi:NAD(P)-dependent dehydrogenase (short-subunit alcohol dehydrogenase family)
VTLTQQLLPSMRRAREGRIIIVSSAGGVRGMPAIAAYSAVKGASERWAESMANEVAPFGLGVSVLITGTFDTDIITDDGAPDYRGFDGPYAPVNTNLERRGRFAMRFAGKPERFETGNGHTASGNGAVALASPVPVDRRACIVDDRTRARQAAALFGYRVRLRQQ